MKEFPSVPSWKERAHFGAPCYVFEKFDGSNLRFEWRRKKGFYKYGTRNRLFGVDEAPFNQALPIFLTPGMAGMIEERMTRWYKGIQEFTVYCEFFGQSSFAGTHDLEEPKHLKLLDIWRHQKGFIPPAELCSMWPRRFDEMTTWQPEILYRGNLNQVLVDAVRDNVLMVGSGEHVQHFPLNEGIVCKGTDRRGQVWMAKVKTNHWLDRLKNKYGDDWVKYE